MSRLPRARAHALSHTSHSGSEGAPGEALGFFILLLILTIIICLPCPPFQPSIQPFTSIVTRSYLLKLLFSARHVENSNSRAAERKWTCSNSLAAGIAGLGCEQTGQGERKGTVAAGMTGVSGLVRTGHSRAAGRMYYVLVIQRSLSRALASTGERGPVNRSHQAHKHHLSSSGHGAYSKKRALAA